MIIDFVEFHEIGIPIDYIARTTAAHNKKLQNAKLQRSFTTYRSYKRRVIKPSIT